MERTSRSGGEGTDLLGLDELELHAAAGPGDEVSVGRVVQQRHQELPQLQGATALGESQRGERE
ncbi:hypothetical protein EYF80_047871 [Liparis tanakae]|uniref:Uncharacterized protein n=1 Tax=Liparis tanakae TaxID=230148 RepID=A0A4Z2FM43_9TELE|nr:hypothetical protein EYF80_047871 [Liparis tanakae]